MYLVLCVNDLTAVGTAATTRKENPLVEQLLYDKSNLSGPALKNAKRLIKKYVDDLAAVLKKEVTGDETILIVDLKREALDKVRHHEMRYFLPNRRPELYS